MPIPIDFDKAAARKILDAIQAGAPIEPPTAAGWNVHALLAVAGACFFAASTHADDLHAAARGGEQWGDQPPEHQEALAERAMAELHAAVEFYAKLMELVADGRYDEVMAGPRAVGAVRIDADGKAHIDAAEGFRREGQFPAPPPRREATDETPR
jgi:hypothetical protein